MNHEPRPIERLFLWRLAATGGGDYIKDVKPAIEPSHREKLVKAGLVEVEKRKPPGVRQAINHVALTDAGWAWLASQRDNEISSRANSAETLRKLLERIHDYLEDSSFSLAELLRPRIIKHEVTQGSSTEAPSPADIASRIESAYGELSAGQVNIRVRLAALRSKLIDVSRDQVDASLLNLALDGKASLYRLDDPREIGPEDREAVWRSPAGDDCHIIYLGGRGT